MSRARCLAVLSFSALLLSASPEIDIAAQAQRARAAMLAGNFREAAGIYRTLTRVLPQDAALRFSLATALYSSAQYKEASQELELIRAAEQQNSSFWFLLGLTRLKLGHPQLALEPLRRAVETGSIEQPGKAGTWFHADRDARFRGC